MAHESEVYGASQVVVILFVPIVVYSAQQFFHMSDSFQTLQATVSYPYRRSVS